MLGLQASETLRAESPHRARFLGPLSSTGPRPWLRISLGIGTMPTSTQRRLLRRNTSIAIAGALVLVGLLRFATDTLHEMDPDYWTALQGTPLRYFVRAPSDGSLLGDLNAQWFKLLSIPCGISFVYFIHLFGGGTAQTRDAEFRDWAVRGTWVFVFLLGFTALEVEKHASIFGTRTIMVEGENFWINHMVHLLSAWLAWNLSGRYTIIDPVPAVEASPEHP